ncbi:LPXTG cell wall anchor domain-containing protein [Bifidobacterium miconisargentati]|uniref:LPXTG cell wall anchor domain-containing protein n=1 Tax=Bifidobacterium miconisargentati TaxID=2834437 RepID=UPI0030844000
MASLVAAATLAGPITAYAVDPAPQQQNVMTEATQDGSYSLVLSAKLDKPADVKVGGSAGVRVTLRLDPGASAPAENVTVNTILHYEGHPGGYVKARQAAKRANATNRGETAGGTFTPSDLGWSSWQEGTYWIEATAARQGHMDAAASTTAHDPTLTFSLTSTRPAAPSRKVEDVTTADGMTNHATVTMNTGVGGWALTLGDHIAGNGATVDVSNMSIRLDGRDVSDEFTLNWDKTSSTVSAVYDGDRMLPSGATLVLEYDATVTNPSTGLVDGTAYMVWNGVEANGSKDGFRQWSPAPDSTWIRYDETAGRWITATDGDATGKTGISGRRVLDGDRLGIAVNGTFPGDPAQTPATFSLTADWSKASYLFSPDVKQARVIMTDTNDATRPTQDDVLASGKDITSSFTLTEKNGTLTATMTKTGMQTLAKHDSARQYTLIVPGKTALASGKGAAQALKDNGKKSGEELDLCADKTGSAYTMFGEQRVNGQTVKSQSTQICGYVPPVTKKVLSTDTGKSIENRYVSIGDTLEYQLVISPNLPDLAYPVTGLTLIDAYDENTGIDPSSIQVRDTEGLLASDRYTKEIDATNHRLTITPEATVLDSWTANGHPRLEVSFQANVSKHVKGVSIRNIAMLQVNGQLVSSNGTTNPFCDDTGACVPSGGQEAGSLNIDGRSLLLGDRFNYRITIKASDLTGTAYPVWRLGAIAQYDPAHLSVDASNVRVIDVTTGKDVTDHANVQTDITGGEVLMFFKTVDTTLKDGTVLPGDPQPENLKEYAAGESHDRSKDPTIDQNLLGHDYQLVLPMTVTATDDKDSNVNATATQITDNARSSSNVISTLLKPISPDQDVTVNVGGDSLNGGSVYAGTQFLYRVDSSTLPADRAIGQINDWTMVGEYDTKADQYTGQWAVYARNDITRDGRTLARKGDRIAGSDYTNPNGEWFTIEHTDGTLTITATKTYLEIMSSQTSDQGWRAYAQFTRLTAVDKAGIKFTETLNGQPRTAQTVWTHTPDQTPRLSIEKWDEASGRDKGDRDSTDQALKLTSSSTRIVFTITNDSGVDSDGQGAWFRTKDLDLRDRLVAGDGEIADIEYPEDWDTLILKPGQSIDVKATLTGVKTHHTDRASVSGVPLIECPTTDTNPFGESKPAEQETVTIEDRTLCKGSAVSSDNDDWNAYNPTGLANTGVKSGMWIAIACTALLLAALGTAVYALRRSKTGQPAADSTDEDASVPDNGIRNGLENVSDPPDDII